MRCPRRSRRPSTRSSGPNRAARAREHADELARRTRSAALRFSRCDQHRSDTHHRHRARGRDARRLRARLAAAREEAGDEELEARREARVAAALEAESLARRPRCASQREPSGSRRARRARASSSPPTSARCAKSAMRCSWSASGSR
jgi:hypothetical protein